MGRISYCPLVGMRCNKPELEAKVHLDTFFLAEPFKPERERRRRERAVKTALKETLKDEFHERSLRVADKEPKDPTIFCDICRLIQSSAYGIVDISGLNPNVLLELGMMFSLGKPVFVLVKKSEEEDLRKKLPSDIVWKRVIPYEEFIDIEVELSKQIQNRPLVEQRPPLAEEVKKVVAEVDPALAQEIDAKLQEIKIAQEKRLKNLEKLLKEARLSETIPKDKKIEISPSLEKQINELCGKVERIEKLVGFPDDPGIALLRGNWHLNRKEYDRALELYDWALTFESDLPAAWLNKAIALGELGKHEEAIACYNKAIEVEPDDEVTWHYKGLVLSELGRHEEAIACYDKAIEIKQDYEGAWNSKGIALGKLGRPEEAIAFFDKAIKIKPDYEKAWNNKGTALSMHERWEEAIACYDKAIKIKPDYEKAWNNKGFAFSKLGRVKEAIVCLEEALRINPNYLAALENFSEALLNIGNLAKGLETAEKALDLAEEPGDKVISWFLCLSAYFFKGEGKRAQEKLEGLVSYLRGLEKVPKVIDWDFSSLLVVIQERLESANKRKLISLISFFKGEIRLEELEKRIRIS